MTSMFTTDYLSINEINLYLKEKSEPLEVRTIIYDEEVEQAAVLTQNNEKKIIGYEEIEVLEVLDFRNKRYLIKK